MKKSRIAKTTLVAVALFTFGLSAVAGQKDKTTASKGASKSDRKESQRSSEAAAKPADEQKVRQTPFGPVRSDGNTEAVQQPAPQTFGPMVEVTEQGDTVIFSRRTPFGRETWKKKRSELTPQERQLVTLRRRQDSPPKSKTQAPAERQATKADSSEGGKAP